MQLLSIGELPTAYAEGLVKTRWPGRAQVVHDAAEAGGLSLFLDGAHTGESAATCAEWFATAALADDTAHGAPGTRVLVFNCMKVGSTDGCCAPPHTCRRSESRCACYSRCSP